MRYYYAEMDTLHKLLSRKGIRVWQILICLAVMAFVCRSVVPTGYMPILSGDKNGTVVLTFCTEDGSNKSLLLNLQQHSKKSPSENHSGQECPYGVVLSHGILPLQDAPLLAGVVWYEQFQFANLRNHALPPLPALGPPLGSRAPPPYLG